jgi:uncharacterized membrane protein
MSRIGVAVLAVGGSMLALDAVWLSFMAGWLYKPNLPGILLDGFRPAPAALFYALYIAGVVYFAVLPAVAARSLAQGALKGALLGLVCYATYDLTNHATMKVWSTLVTVADMAWGAFLTGCAATAGTWAVLRRA